MINSRNLIYTNILDLTSFWDWLILVYAKLELKILIEHNKLKKSDQYSR